MPAPRPERPRGLLLWAALALAAGCARQDGSTVETYTFQGPTMGTVYEVKVVSAEPLPKLRQAELARAVETELEQVNQRMSTYVDDSELSLFNRHAETTPFELSAETLEVLEQALAVSRLTGGAFDVTVGPLVNAWGFGPEVADGHRPSDEELASLLGRIGFAKLEIDTAAGTARKLEPELYCDLSAIAKGYAVDRVVEALTAMGVSHLMAEVGGEVRTAGRNARGGTWRIGIERPGAVRGSVQRIVPLADRAMATSGDYRNYQELDGKRISHVIDPRDGQPAAHRLASVTVLHEECSYADALATALMVLGEEEGGELAQAEDLAALFLIRDPAGGFVERTTPAFDDYLRSLEAPGGGS